MENQIKFSARWDKLDEPIFTTFRRWRSDKEAYYRSHLGEHFDVVLVVGEFTPAYQARTLARATLRDVRAVDPCHVDLAELWHDVQLEGAVHSEWLGKILAMRRALRLEFEILGPVSREILVPVGAEL